MMKVSTTIAVSSSGLTINQDFFFGDGEISQIPFDYEHLNNTDTSQDWTLPNEAFEPRHDILTRSAMPPQEFSSKCLSGEMQDSGGCCYSSSNVGVDVCGRSVACFSYVVVGIMMNNLYSCGQLVVHFPLLL